MIIMTYDSIGNGSWITAGITTDDVVTKGNLTIVTCRSTHLTSFAVLVDVVGGLAVILMYCASRLNFYHVYCFVFFPRILILLSE